MLNKTQETIYYVESIHTPHFHLWEILDQQALTSYISSDFCCVVLKSYKSMQNYGLIYIFFIVA